jgi:hypothetical protein
MGIWQCCAVCIFQLHPIGPCTCASICGGPSLPDRGLMGHELRQAQRHGEIVRVRELELRFSFWDGIGPLREKVGEPALEDRAPSCHHQGRVSSVS